MAFKHAARRGAPANATKWGSITGTLADQTDLQAAIDAVTGAAEVNDLTAAVTWANVPVANIVQASVTQHEAALTILETQVTDGTLLARVAANETISGAWQFSNRLVLDDSTAARAGLNLQEGITPTSPIDGDVWVTTTDMFARVNGESVSLIAPTITDGAAGGDMLVWDGDSWEPATTVSYQDVEQAFRIDDVEVFAFPAGVASSADPYWANVQVLALLDGADAATTDTTEDAYARAITFVNTAQLDTAQKPWTESTSSLLLDGDLSPATYAWATTSANNFNLAASDFTIECMVRFNVTPSTSGNGMPFISKWDAVNTREFIFQYYVDSKMYFNYTLNGTNSVAIGTSTTWSPSTNTWYHVAVCRDGNNLRFFVDGTQIGTTSTALTGVTIASTSSRIEFGHYENSETTSQIFNGWISDARVTVGTARYTSNFTAPTEPLPGGTGVAGANTLTVGDALYATVIDGLTTNLTSASVDIDGTLNVDGASTLVGNVGITGTLITTGAATLNSGLTVTGNPIVAGTVAADFGAITGTSYGGILEANLLDKSATEAVSGAYTFSGGVTVTTANIVAGTVDADFGAITGTSYGGITEANLLDKSAAETISGAWTFQDDIFLSSANARIKLGVQASTGDGHVGTSGIGAPTYGSQDYGTYIAYNAYRQTDGAWKHSRTATTGATRYINGYSIGHVWDYSANVGAANITWTNLMTLSTAGVLSILDAGNTDFAAFSHDGTNFNTAFTNTASWQITGLGSSFQIYNGANASFNYAIGAGLELRDGTYLRIQDSFDTDYGQFNHTGTNFETKFVNTSIWDIQLDGSTSGITFTVANASKIYMDKAGGNFDIRDGWNLIIRDTGDTDYATFGHDGTDFNTALTNTTDWNITGATGAYRFDRPVVMLHGSAVANSAGAAQINYQNSVAGTEWQVGCSGDGTDDFIIYSTTSAATRFTIDDADGLVTIANDLTIAGVTKIKERAAAVADTAAYGQLWVKNTTPCELWFTDDAGTDTKIV